MLIGLCTSALANAAVIAPSGLDYIEENVQTFLAPEGPDTEFTARLASCANAARTISVGCCFLPGSHRCVGPQVDEARLLAYAESAFARARRTGIDTIVFGSGGARAVPEGFSAATAFTQFISMLGKMAPIAARHGVTIVVEPLNRGEVNFINTIDEGAEVVNRVGHPSVRLLADLFHMLRNGETPDAITRHGALLAHAHLAEQETRSAPGIKGDDFRPFLRALRQVGYDRRLSLECAFGNLGSELDGSLKVLRGQLADAGY